MKWTKKAPTEAGWYWHGSDLPGEIPELALITIIYPAGRPVLFAYLEGRAPGYFIGTLGWWYGPIQPPVSP